MVLAVANRLSLSPTIIELATAGRAGYALAMAAPPLVVELVARFAQHVDAYKAGRYNETQLRRDFLDPFLGALGWDMNNERGYAEAYRDVIHEDAVRVSGALKAPDYGFRIGGTRKFFLEAKKPSIRIKEEAPPAYQLRRYAWSAKLPLSILTDFEEFAVYDCRIKPLPDDSASVARTFYCRFDQYAEHWNWIESIFSREAVLKGSFDKYAVATKAKRGTTPVDKEFLSQIEGWRDELARSLARRNPSLTQVELNFAVQRTIDRIVFLRICEDRGIEDYRRLRQCLDAPCVYDALVALFQQADDRYNSGLFHFRSERNRHEHHDSLTPSLKVDDNVLARMIAALYYPDSPYEFSVIGADILGQVYEQFLGKVIRLTDGHHAKVEDKPEVKKAGGVFYTPTFVVQYMVEATIRPLVDGKTPRQIERLRILDPACGSGSFLIGAYQFLLDWYRQWYESNEPEKWAKGTRDREPGLVATAGGGWALTTSERKRILLSHIFGVDIDAQAVEVTKLSLLLKVLEGETAQTVQRELIHERVLPDLGMNIRCGNSLIGTDFYRQPGLPALHPDGKDRLNAFDWSSGTGFPNIMAVGGFDVVIGNPPYVRIQRIPHAESDYLFATYETPTSKMDLSLVFVENALKLINGRGRVSFICTSQWLAADYGRKLRARLSQGELEEIVDFDSLPVFEKASTYPAILILGRGKAPAISVRRVQNREELTFRGIVEAPVTRIDRSALSSGPWVLGKLDIGALAAARPGSTMPLRSFGKAYIGCKTGLNEAFVVTRQTAVEERLEEDFLLPYAYQGEEIARFSQIVPDALVIYPYRPGPNGNPELVPETELRTRTPRVYEHLLRFKADLKARKDSRRHYAAGTDWYRHLRPGNFGHIDKPKLMFKAIAKEACGGLLGSNTAFDGANCPAILLEALRGHSENYLLGVLNSAVASFYLRQVCPPKLSGYMKVSATCLSGTPIPLIDFKEKSSRDRHERISALVGEMLLLTTRRGGLRVPQEREANRRQLEATERAIDDEVFALFGLTDQQRSTVADALEAIRRPPQVGGSQSRAGR